MEETLEGARLHTAEHLFARALQDQKLDIHVRKADTYNVDNIGKAYIKEIIPFENIKTAEITVNQNISVGLEIKEKNFANISEAVKENPKLRFNADRLDGKQTIRVISIGDYDFSACKHMHVNNTNEIVAFSVTRVSYLGGETEVEFLAGENAIRFMINTKNALLDVAMKNHFIAEKVNEYIDNQIKQISSLEKEEKTMLAYILEMTDDVIELKDIKLSAFYGEINGILRKKPEKSIALTNYKQLIIMKGGNSNKDFITLGDKLKKEGFTGNISETAINGKADEKIIDILKKEWKS